MKCEVLIVGNKKDLLKGDQSGISLLLKKMYRNRPNFYFVEVSLHENFGHAAITIEGKYP